MAIKLCNARRRVHDTKITIRKFELHPRNVHDCVRNEGVVTLTRKEKKAVDYKIQFRILIVYNIVYISQNT